MSFLQTVGIASQASDAFDDQRQSRRMNNQREQAGQMALDDNVLYREIVKMAYQHHMSKEQRAAAAKAMAGAPARGAVQAPMAPGLESVAGDMSSPLDQRAGPVGYADGGSVISEVEKFSGIYDDMKSGARIPTIYREYLEQARQPGFKNGGLVKQAIMDLVTDVERSYADGGEILIDEEEERRRLLEEGLVASGSNTSTRAKEPYVPGPRSAGDPSKFAGRLVNSVGAAPEPVNTSTTRSPAPVSAQVNAAAWEQAMANQSSGDTPAAQGEPNPPADPNSLLGMVEGLLGFVGQTAISAFAPPPMGQIVGQSQAQNAAVAEAVAAAQHAQVGPVPDQTMAQAEGQNPNAPDPSQGQQGPVPDQGMAQAEGVAPSAPGSDPAADAAAAGGAGDAGAGDTGGGDPWVNGGFVSIWDYVKKRSAPKARPKAKRGAVKFKHGGSVQGPGTGTSDSVKGALVHKGKKQPVRLSDGEYVLSADTVRAVGKDKLDALQAKYHKPVR